MRQRILAIVGAVALVVVALVVRGIVTDSNGASGTGGGKPVVACTTDLMAVCQALADSGAIAADPPTLELADAATATVDNRPLDGWITWDPAPGIANLDAETGGSSRPWSTPQVLGASPLGIASLTAVSPSLPSGCSFSPVVWDCVARAAIDEQTPIGIGTGTTAGSLARLYPLARALVPKEGNFRDIETAGLKAIIESTNVAQADFPNQARTLVTQRGALDILVGPSAGLTAIKGTRTAVAPQSADTVDATVVLVGREGSNVASVAKAATASGTVQALRDAGVVPGTGRLAPEGRAGELYAVRDKVDS